MRRLASGLALGLPDRASHVQALPALSRVHDKLRDGGSLFLQLSRRIGSLQHA